MKLSIFTDEVSQDLETVLRFARETRLDGIEVRSVFGKAFRDLNRAEWSEIARRCREEGLAVSGVATPVFKCALDESAEIAEHVEIFRNALEAAKVLQCQVVRVFTFLGGLGEMTARQSRQVAAAFTPLLELVRGTPFLIGVENEASCLVATGEEMRMFLGHFPRLAPLGVVWDPCNVLFRAGATDPVRDDYELVADRVWQVHAKDARREGGQAAARCVELGTGSVDWARQFAALRRRGFEGWVTLETHWRAVPLDAATQHLPSGEAFSNGAEPASRICLENLRECLAQSHRVALEPGADGSLFASGNDDV